MTTLRLSRWATITCVLIATLTLCAGTSVAQERFEIAGEIGYAFSEGIDVTRGSELLDVKKLSPRDGMSFGFNAEVYIDWGVTFGYLWNQQNSTLGADLRPVGDLDLADMTLRNNHFTLTYHVMDRRSKVRPFFQGGLGWTTASADAIMGIETNSESRFSSIWGLGVKYYASDRFGFKLTGRWTPTYIKSDPAGYWCGYYCYPVVNPDYINQFAITAAIIIRG